MESGWMRRDHLKKALLGVVLLMTPIGLVARVPETPSPTAGVTNRAPEDMISEVKILGNIDNPLEDRNVAIEKLREFPSKSEEVIPALMMVAQNPDDQIDLRLKAMHDLSQRLSLLSREEGAGFAQLSGTAKALYVEGGIMPYGHQPMSYLNALKKMAHELPPGTASNVKGVLALNDETFQEQYVGPNQPYPGPDGAFDEGLIVIPVSGDPTSDGFPRQRNPLLVRKPIEVFRHEFGHAAEVSLSAAAREKLAEAHRAGHEELKELISSLAAINEGEAFAEVFASWQGHCEKLFLPAIERSATARLFIETVAKSFIFVDRDGTTFIRFLSDDSEDENAKLLDVPIPPGSGPLTYLQLKNLYLSAQVQRNSSSVSKNESTTTHKVTRSLRTSA